MITSRTNQKVKNVRKLLSSGKERKETGTFVIEGERLCMEAPAELVVEVFVTESYHKRALQKKDVVGAAGKWLADLETTGCVEIVEDAIFKELSDTVNPQGVLAVVRKPAWGRWHPIPYQPDPEITPDGGQESIYRAPGTQENAMGIPMEKSEEESGESHKILLLDGIRDPGNLGTIVRTSEAAGVQAIFMSPDCVDLFNPKVIRSTMGSVFRVPIYTADLVTVIKTLQEQGMEVYATSLSAAISYREADLRNAALVIGSEANGVSQPVLDAAGQSVIIPMQGQIESLNAAVSAAILLFT